VGERRGAARRPVRGWSLKVRGTGLIGLMGRRRESGGVGLGSGAALPRVGVHFRFQAAHARCNRRPPGFLSPSPPPPRSLAPASGVAYAPPRQVSTPRKTTTTTPVSIAGGKRASPPPSLVDHHHCRFPGHHRVLYRSDATCPLSHACTNAGIGNYRARHSREKLDARTHPFQCRALTLKLAAFASLRERST